MPKDHYIDDASHRLRVRKHAFSAVRWTAIGSMSRAVIAFGQLVILSRLISPAEYGAAALILALLTMAASISDAGLSSAVIRFRDISQPEKSSLYWLNLTFGFGMTFASMGVSTIAASFYGLPELRDLILISSLTFILNAAGLQLRVSAERDLKFNRIILAEISSSLLGAAISIILALWDWGAYSIACGQVATSFLLLVLTWTLLAGQWRPSFTFKLRDARRFLSFGMDMFLVNFVTGVTVQIDMLIAGRLLPPHLLAFYSQPRDLCMRIMLTVNPVITRVGLPLMARHQSDPKFVGELYLKTVRMSSSIMFPIFAMISLMSFSIVEIVMGSDWHGAASVLPLVSLWFLVRSVVNTVGSLLTALGKSRMALYYQCLALAFVASGSYVGARYGIESVAPALIFVNVVLVECVWAFVLRPICGVGFLRYHLQFTKPTICTVLAATVGYFVRDAVDGNLVKLLCTGASGVAIYLLSSTILNREWLRDMIHFLQIGGGRQHS